tara:strand:+ start:25940 stop:27232 length:1293 start_codon:yes stop_codon:yes gene_type:complete
MEEHIHKHVDEDMLSVEDALTSILQHFQKLPTTNKPILETLGYTLATDIYSSINLPPTPNSGMDGYAVIANDVAGYTESNPITLKVIGTVPAGSVPTITVSHGTAVRIMTGASIPYGATAVVPFEETDEVSRLSNNVSLEEISINTKIPEGANIRAAAEDVKIGDLILESNISIRQQEIAVLASLGLSHAEVIRKPVVGVISTGDELTELGQNLGHSKIYDSNSYGLCAAIQASGGIAKRIGIAEDTLEDLEKAINACYDCDLILTSAGVSKGDYDFVKEVLTKNGEMNFWSVRMRPAKPLAFGIINIKGTTIPLIGLPGNPVSALVAFEMFGRPSILKMRGKQKLNRTIVSGTLNGTIHNFDGRRVYARVVVSESNSGFIATPTGPQGSNILTSMSKSNGLAICPENETSKQNGDTVKIIMTDWNEEVT